jgi:hypothetical protein
MDFRPGEQHQRPPDAPPSWFGEALLHIRRQRLGDIAIAVYIRGGGIVLGGLLDPSEVGEDEDLDLVHVTTPHRDEPVPVPCDEIASFVLLPDPLLDSSGEPRGERD